MSESQNHYYMLNGGYFVLFFFSPLLDVNCTETKPTTKPAFAVRNFIQSTTSSPSTVRVETAEVTSTKQTSPPQTNSSETELPPDQTGSVHPPDVGASKGQRESPSSTSSKHHCMHRSFNVDIHAN